LLEIFTLKDTLRVFFYTHLSAVQPVNDNYERMSILAINGTVLI